MKHKGVIFYLIAVIGVVIVKSVHYSSNYYPQVYNSTWYPRHNYSNNYGFNYPIHMGYVNFANRSKILPNRTNNYGWNYSNAHRYKRFSNYGYQYPPPVIHQYVPVAPVYQYAPPNAHQNIPPAASNKSHHLITGIVRFGDHLVYNKNITDEPFTWFGKVSKYVTYPPRGVPNTRNITVIQVYDLIQDGTGGWARIVNGGVGYRNVTMKLKSQTGKRMSFQVLIYTN